MVGRDLGPIAEVQQQLVKTQLELEKDYEAQREAETRFRVLMGQTRDALVFVDAKSGPDRGHQRGRGRRARRRDRGRDRRLLLPGVRGSSAGRVPRQPERLSRQRRAAAGGDSRRNRTALKIHSTLFRAAGRMVLLCRLEADVQSETVGEELGVQPPRALRPRFRRRGLHGFPRRHPRRQRGLPEPARRLLGRRARRKVDLRVPRARQRRPSHPDRRRRPLGAGPPVLDPARDGVRRTAPGRHLRDQPRRAGRSDLRLRDARHVALRSDAPPPRSRRPATSPATSSISSAPRRSRTSSPRPPT